jgi:hypothetical protein
VKKYLVCPGRIRSRADGDLHFISARQLIHLYGVNPAECMIRRPGIVPQKELEGKVILAPRYDGDYSLPAHPLQSPQETKGEADEHQ